MESAIFSALKGLEFSPQFLVVIGLMVVHLRNQNEIIKEIVKGMRSVSDRVLVLETKQNEST